METETRINIRIAPDLKKKFLQWCKDNGTTPSDELRRYITKLVKAAK